MQFKKLLAALTLAAAPALASAELVVIVNAGAGVSSLDKGAVEAIFSGKAGSLPGGAKAQPVDNAAAAGEFYQKVTGKSAAQMKAHWAKLGFTGKAQPPKEAGNGRDASAQVAATPGGIGYAERAEVGSGVKIVMSVN